MKSQSDRKNLLHMLNELNEDTSHLPNQKLPGIRDNVISSSKDLAFSGIGLNESEKKFNQIKM